MLVEMTSTPVRLERRPVAASVDELLADATRRESFFNTDSKSGSHFERVWIDGEPHIVKYVHVDHDFTMRGLGDIGPRPLLVWEAGLMDAAPDVIDHTVVGVARGYGRHGWGAALLMRDVGEHLVPAGDELLPLEQHLAFMDHLAAMSARMWDWHDDVGLVPYRSRWQWFNPENIAAEEALGFPEAVPRIAAEGWARFEARVPRRVDVIVQSLRRDLSPLEMGLRATPSTFLHGDWKAGNLGFGPDGRTILIDWTYPGEGPVCHELGWYLAINRSRLPQSKEETIDALRAALERHGVRTEGWWEQQVALCLLGTVVQHGWEKALGDDDELGWWCERVVDAAAWLA
jgi:hypothetical protein